MTPEERAAAWLRSRDAPREVMASLIPGLAAQIREAMLEEREGCARAAAMWPGCEDTEEKSAEAEIRRRPPP